MFYYQTLLATTAAEEGQRSHLVHNWYKFTIFKNVKGFSIISDSPVQHTSFLGDFHIFIAVRLCVWQKNNRFIRTSETEIWFFKVQIWYYVIRQFEVIEYMY